MPDGSQPRREPATADSGDSFSQRCPSLPPLDGLTAESANAIGTSRRSARRSAIYHQICNPFGNAFVSTIVAAIPIFTLLDFIALHPHRDANGVRHLGIAAPWAAFYGVIAAFVVACIPFGMPLAPAGSALLLGMLSGFLGIIWIVLGAMFLCTMTVTSGQFEIVKESIVHISFDRRLQCVLIAFPFGAIIEGTSGFGTPVAIAGAVMVGLG